MSKYIIIHGYGSNPETSSTANTLKQIITLVDDNAEILTPSYDESNPQELINSMANVIDDNTIIMGSSLGGYLSRYLANTYNAKKLLMINPSIDAPNNLKKYIDDGKMTESACSQYSHYYLSKDNPDLDIMVVVATNDNVVDPNTTIKLFEHRAMIRYGVGGHRMTDLIEFHDDICKFINIVHD